MTNEIDKERNEPSSNKNRDLNNKIISNFDNENSSKQQNNISNNGQFNGQHQNPNFNNRQFNGQHQNPNFNNGQFNGQHQNPNFNKGQFNGQHHNPNFNNRPFNGQHQFYSNNQIPKFQGNTQKQENTNKKPLPKFLVPAIVVTVIAVLSITIFLFLKGANKYSTPENAIKTLETNLRSADLDALIDSMHFKNSGEKQLLLAGLNLNSNVKKEIEKVFEVAKDSKLEVLNLDNHVSNRMNVRYKISGINGKEDIYDSITLVNINGEWKIEPSSLFNKYL